jgi:hypothetical protein
VPGVEPRGTRRWSRISEFRLFSPRLRAHTRVFAPLQIVKDQPRAPGATEAADGPPIAQHLILPHIYGISNSFLNYFCNPLAHVSRRADEGAEGKTEIKKACAARATARQGKQKLKWEKGDPPSLKPWRDSPMRKSGLVRFQLMIALCSVMPGSLYPTNDTASTAKLRREEIHVVAASATTTTHQCKMREDYLAELISKSAATASGSVMGTGRQPSRHTWPWREEYMLPPSRD